MRDRRIMSGPKIWHLLIIMAAYGSGFLFADTSVRIWKEPLVIPTYIPGPPEPNPIFYSGRAYQGAKGPIYPYPLLDRLTDNRQDKTYQAVYLENPYVKICVLPEIGGRIFSAIDKSDNYDFIYRQHVIKPALIGMLGAWISGGVEWNIPHHHRASTYMTVESDIVDNPDGSKTAWVGEIELRHRTKWLVGLTLRPESSALEVTMKVLNRTPLANSILCWANVAVHANENYQIIFPPSTSLATFHGKNQFASWPISREVYNRQDYTRGVDVSWWKSHELATSLFAWNAEEDFLAGYDHGKKAGVAFIADHNTVPGKKVWTWGTGSEGRAWDKILTDADGPYLELMIGAWSDNQPDYSWTQPYEAKVVKQIWYPIRGIGGVKSANAEAACNLEVVGENKARFGFYSTSPLKRAKVQVKAGDDIIHEEQIDIAPDSPYAKEIDLAPGIKEENLSIRLMNADGREIVAYQPLRKEPSAMPSPVTPPPPPKDVKTVEELYLAGLRLQQFYNPALEPDPYYEEALRRDPSDYRVNTALGLLYLKRARYPEAEERLREAIKRATAQYTRPKDGEAFYYLGVALRLQGKDAEAEDAFQRAAWSSAWHAAAFYQAAELSVKKSDLAKALGCVVRSLAANGLNTKALSLKAAILRKLGKPDEALKAASEVRSLDPLDFWARNELYLAGAAIDRKDADDGELAGLKALMRDSSQNYLELAADYGNAGLFEEAIDVLKRLVPIEKATVDPQVYYHLGYYLDKNGDPAEALKCAGLAATIPRDYVFPFQSESLDILRWAQRISPHDARAPYYLGNYLFDLQPLEAVKEWERSRALDGSFSIIQRNLGLAYARIENDLSKAIAALEKAVAINPGDPRLYCELDTLYEAGDIPAAKRLAIIEKNHKVVSLRDDALAREVLLLIQTGRFDRAVQVLKTHHFHVWEGGGEIHSLWVEAHLLRGWDDFEAGKPGRALEDFKAALEYPANLEAGPPSQGAGTPKILYGLGRAAEGLGRKDEAKGYYEKASVMRVGWSEESYWQGLSLQKIGKEAEAQKVFEDLAGYARERLDKAPSMDFFEKFGERQSARTQTAQAHLLLGLGHLGAGRSAEAAAEFKKALEINPNIPWAQRYSRKLKK